MVTPSNFGLPTFGANFAAPVTASSSQALGTTSLLNMPTATSLSGVNGLSLSNGFSSLTAPANLAQGASQQDSSQLVNQLLSFILQLFTLMLGNLFQGNQPPQPLAGAETQAPAENAEAEAETPAAAPAPAAEGEHNETPAAAPAPAAETPAATPAPAPAETPAATPAPAPAETPAATPAPAPAETPAATPPAADPPAADRPVDTSSAARAGRARLFDANREDFVREVRTKNAEIIKDAGAAAAKQYDASIAKIKRENPNLYKANIEDFNNERAAKVRAAEAAKLNSLVAARRTAFINGH